MASKFTNTKHNNTINSLVDGYKDKIKNPYYIHQDTQPCITTYFNQDTNKSTLDEGSKTEYSALGDNSPLKFNQINNFHIYGLEKIITELEYGDWGLESSSIEGECTILPNTIVPIPNDFFIINHTDKKMMFKVLSVSVNTIENGSNLYRISYKMDQYDDSKIKDQINETFEMIVTNTGTQFKTIIRSSDYDYIDRVEELLDRLKVYYKNLFYSSRVQTFIFMIGDTRFYDPFMIEFLSRNDLLKDDRDYLYIAHQTVIPATFALDYDKTFFRLIEHPNLKRPKPRINSQATLIDEYLSILSTRAEDYFKISYVGDITNPNMYTINNFDIELIDRIYNNKLYEGDNYLNIIIKYFNKTEITSNDVFSIENVDFEPEMRLFYNIPIIIYILEDKVKSILLNK